MANSIYADQLLHLVARAALESFVTGVTGVERLGVKAPDLETLIGEIANSPTANTMMDRLKAIATAINTTNGKDFATQTTLAAILAKIIAAPATEAKQDTGNTALANILAAMPSGFATAALQATGNGKLDSIIAALAGSFKNVLYNSSGAEIGTETDPLVIKIGDAGIEIPTNLQAVLRSELLVCTTALAAGATYTSTGFDCIKKKTITGTVYADQSGALYIQQSRDGSAYRSLTTITVAAGTPQGFSVPVYSRYVRAYYVNGGTAQGVFELTLYDAPN
jgi:hypothetical protein